MPKALCLCMQKVNLVSHIFSEILQRHCEVAILVNLGILGHPHQKSYYQFLGNFHDYLHAKTHLHHSLLS